MRATLFVLALAMAGLAAPALAHRMPEVDVVMDVTDLEGQPATSLVFHLEAADVLKLLGLERELSVDLREDNLLRMLSDKVQQQVVVAGGKLTYFGGEVEGDTVYLFYTAPLSINITDARVLTSVYDQWTNRINDQRGDEVVTTVFTQGGALEGHHH